MLTMRLTIFGTYRSSLVQLTTAINVTEYKLYSVLFVEHLHIELEYWIGWMSVNIIFCFWFRITTANKHVNGKKIINAIDGNIINVNDNNCKLCENSAVWFVLDLHLTQWLDGGLYKDEKALTKSVGLDHQTRKTLRHSITDSITGNILPTKTLGLEHQTRNGVDSGSDGSSLWTLNAEY